MTKKKTLLIAVLVFLLSTACLNLGGLGQKALDKALEEADIPEGAIETAQAGFEAVATEALTMAEGAMDDVMAEPGEVPFPVPDGAENLMNIEGNVNFQVAMSVDGVVAFYRQTLTSQGYKERDITTVIEDGIASIVFDGDPSGKALVVQVVTLGENSNVNVRLEDIAP